MAIGLDDIYTGIKNVGSAAQSIASSLKNGLPQVGGTSTTATGGAATLPANPVGFLNVTLPDGTAAKIPYYGS